MDPTLFKIIVGMLIISLLAVIVAIIIIIFDFAKKHEKKD